MVLFQIILKACAVPLAFIDLAPTLLITHTTHFISTYKIVRNKLLVKLTIYSPLSTPSHETLRLKFQINLTGQCKDELFNFQVLGVSLNGILNPGDTSKALAKLKLLNDHKFSKIFTMLYSITNDLELFKKYDVEKIFECRIVSVDSRARGKGLATELFRRTIQLAKDFGFKVKSAYV